MNADLWSAANTSPPYTPLPTEHRQFIQKGLIQSFAPAAIRDEHEFTAKTSTGRLKVNCVAFTDNFHLDLDTSAVAIYYEPENKLSDNVILERMIFSGAPFVFIGRERELLPYGMKLNGKLEPQRLGNALAYHEIGEFLDKYKVDINPKRISAVKGGTAQFEAFRQLNSFQFRLFTLEITRDLLAENFGAAVNSLRETFQVGQKAKPQEEIITEIAVQLLGAIVLAHKGRLSSECLEQTASFGTVFKCAATSFPNYFDWKLIEQYSHAAEAAYHLLRQATYSSFTPDMLTELYLRAYPDAEKRKLEGRFDTPLYLTRRIVDNLPIETIRPEKRLLADITCGWGSFLVAGYERLSRMADMAESQRPPWEHIVGNDIDRFTTKLARLALLTTSLKDSWEVDNQDALKLKWLRRSPTVIVGNPKFRADRRSGEEATEIDETTGEPKRLQEADDFLMQTIKLLEPGGYLGILMPQSFLVAEASTVARKTLLERCDVLELWDLPIATFGEQATVSPMVIFAQKRKDAGNLVNYPVRIRVAQGQTFAHIGIFNATSLAVSQSKWGSESKKARRSKAKVTHLITYTTILPEAKWNEIFGHCRRLTDIADITPGATVGTKRPWVNFSQPKQVPWLYGAKQSMPYPFLIRYGSETILYPNDLERPRKNRRYPHKDSERLLASPKVLLVSDPNPSWGRRAKVAIERRGFYPSNHFWVCVPKSNETEKVSLEVLAAVLSWDVSNAWIIESVRNPWVPKRALEDIPIPELSDSDCRRLEKAISEIEAAALHKEPAPKAQQVLDDVLKKAYRLDDKTFRILRQVMEWDSQQEIKMPVLPNSKTIFRVSGEVEAVNAPKQKITLWFDGIPGTHTVPIVDGMPGWMLREGAAFRAEISYQALRNENWQKLKWWNIHPKEYTYLTEDELLDRLAIELAPA